MITFKREAAPRSQALPHAHAGGGQRPRPGPARSACPAPRPAPVVLLRCPGTSRAAWAPAPALPHVQTEGMAGHRLSLRSEPHLTPRPSPRRARRRRGTFAGAGAVTCCPTGDSPGAAVLEWGTPGPTGRVPPLGRAGGRAAKTTRRERSLQVVGRHLPVRVLAGAARTPVRRRGTARSSLRRRRIAGRVRRRGLIALGPAPGGRGSVSRGCRVAGASRRRRRTCMAWPPGCSVIAASSRRAGRRASA